MRHQPVALAFTAAVPSVEMWWRATSGRAALVPGRPAGWPHVTVADTRGILRREPITPELSRAMRETLAAGTRIFLAVSRLASALACDECGLVMRCPACAVALSYARSATTLTCRVCGVTMPLPETCPECTGRRLTPFGWGAERVEHAVRRRFPHARIARYEPESGGARAAAQRAAAAQADIVIGTRGALRLFGRAALGLAGFVSPDQLLRLPDFRAGERTLGFLWAAAERVRPNGQLVIQSQHPAHHAFAAVTQHDLERFYVPELRFRSELGYPPFRRLAIITVPAGGHALADVTAALTGSGALTVYPATLARGGRMHRIVVKGRDDLPEALATALADGARARAGTSRGAAKRGPGGTEATGAVDGAVPGGTRAVRGRARDRGIIDVEVDPVEWQY
jgi:primosomal protein N' (replication factor Y)